MEHKTTRVIPAGKSAGALIEALRNAIGSASDGYRTELDGRVILIFRQEATQADMNVAIQLAETWDFDTKTVEELTADELSGDFADVLTRYANSNLAHKTPQQIYDLVQGQIDGWTTLAAAKAGLRTLLPLIAAGVQLYLRDRL